MMSSADRWLRSSTAVTSSAEPSSTSSRVSASTWIAPRMARTLIAGPRRRPVRALRLAASMVSSLYSPTPPAPQAPRAAVPRARSHPHRPVQRADLRVAAPSEPAGPLVAQLHLPHRGAQEPQHRVAHLVQQPPDDVLAALVDHQLDHRAARVRVDEAEPVDDREPVLQLDALAKPPAQVARDRALYLGEVGLLHLERRVHEAVAELAVVHEQQQALGVGVEAPDVEQPRPRAAVEVLVHGAALDEEVADAAAALVVVHGRQHAAGLVQREVSERLVEHDAQPVDVNDDLVGVHPPPHLADDLAVDGHPPGGDQLFGRPPGRHAGLGQHLLQPDAVRVLLGHQITLSSSIASMSGSSGASGGRSASEVRPSRSRKSSVVANRVPCVAGSVPASWMRPRVSSVRSTPSQLTPRTADTRARVTGWR